MSSTEGVSEKNVKYSVTCMVLYSPVIWIYCHDLVLVIIVGIGEMGADSCPVSRERNS